jgi:excisionase family DNA binding protein
LAISERQLWQLTHDGAIHAVRIGRSVRYDLDDIREFIAARKSKANTVLGGGGR